MKARLAFATCPEFPTLSESDLAAAKELISLGFQVEAAVWNSKVNWATYDAIIIRATWFYWLRYSEFLKWLNHLDENKIKVLNSTSLLRWNTNKLYLKELEAKGVPFVPTEWILPEEKRKLTDVMKQRGWTEVIIKPVISGGAFETHRFSLLEASHSRNLIDKLLKLGPVMVQPFLNEIISEGEYSFLFFEGVFSHAILKTAIAGDFRVQHFFGGAAHVIMPSEESIKVAKNVLDHVPEPTLYARVDMINIKGSLFLMELELTEPHLFLLEEPQAVSRFTKAVCQFLTNTNDT